MSIMTDDHTDQRLRRIEEKIDGHIAYFEKIARLDEKLVSYMSFSSRMGTEMDKMKAELEKVRERVREAEATNRTQQLTISYGERIFWLLVSGALGSLYLFGGR